MGLTREELNKEIESSCPGFYIKNASALHRGASVAMIYTYNSHKSLYVYPESRIHYVSDDVVGIPKEELGKFLEVMNSQGIIYGLDLVKGVIKTGNSERVKITRELDYVNIRINYGDLLGFITPAAWGVLDISIAPQYREVRVSMDDREIEETLSELENSPESIEVLESISAIMRSLFHRGWVIHDVNKWGDYIEWEDYLYEIKNKSKGQ